jgi:ATP-binding cassette subfamily B protein
MTIVREINPQPSLFTLLLGLWSHIQSRRRLQLAFVAALMLMSTFAELLSFSAVLPFLAALSSPDKLYTSPWMVSLISLLELTSPSELLLPISILFGLAVLLSGATRLVLLWAQTRLSFAIGADLGLEAYRRVLYQPYSVHISHNSAEITSSIMNKVGGLVFIAILPVMNLISALLMLLSAIVVLLAVDPIVSIYLFVGFGGIYLLITVIFRRDLLLAGQQVTREQTNLMKAMQEGLGGIRDIIIDGTQESFIRVFKDSDVILRQASAKIAIIGGTPRYIVEVAAMLLIGSIAYFLSGRLGGLMAAIPVLGFVALVGQRTLPLLQQTYSNVTMLLGGKAVLIDSLLLLDQPIPQEKLAKTTPVLAFREAVLFQKVSFRYGPQAPWILRDINLEIRRGDRIGIIGTTGSGKSTMVDILMGLLSPTEGCLLVDGIAINKFEQSSWQRHIAHVPQNIYLADSAISDNIAFGISAEKVDMRRVINAAINAQIDSTIQSWPKTYKTRVGERGIRLSGGQRQRIGIARALYKNADIIIFDEATSALDIETEQAVVSAIDGLDNNLTIVIVAHRLSTLKSCDRIIKITDGMVSWMGTFQELTSIKENA